MLKIIAIKTPPNFNLTTNLAKFNLLDRQTILSFRFKKDQIIAFASEVLKKYYLAKLLKEQLGSLILENGVYGKPYLASHPNVYFNISHSGEYVILAISDQEIGIDIELGDNIDSTKIHDMSRLIYSSSEQQEIGIDRDKFLIMWAKKEALIKCGGVGFVSDEYLRTELTLEDYQEIEGFNIFTCRLFGYYHFGLAIKSIP